MNRSNANLTTADEIYAEISSGITMLEACKSRDMRPSDGLYLLYVRKLPETISSFPELRDEDRWMTGELDIRMRLPETHLRFIPFLHLKEMYGLVKALSKRVIPAMKYLVESEMTPSYNEFTTALKAMSK